MRICGVNGVNIRFFVCFCFRFCFGLFFSLSVHQFSPYPDVSFLSFLLIYAIFSGSSSWFSTLGQSPRVRTQKPHENGGIARAYNGVNGVTFRVIPQSSASGSSSDLSFPSFWMYAILHRSKFTSLDRLDTVCFLKLLAFQKKERA